MNTYQITLVVYRPYTQVIEMEAEHFDDAIDEALTNVDYDKFVPSNELPDNIVEIHDVNPPYDKADLGLYEDEEGDDEDSENDDNDEHHYKLVPMFGRS